MAPSSPDASIVNSTSKLLADLDLSENHRLLMQDMEDMDIDMVMEVPDTPDRLAASQNGNGGEEIGEIVKSPVVLNSRMPNLVDKGVYNRIRNHDKLSTENVNNGRLSHCSGDNSFLNEIKQNSGPIVSLHDSPSVSVNADIFRKMMTEKVSSGHQTTEHVSSSNNRVKLDNDSPIIVDVLASDEKNRNRNKGKTTDLISTEKMPSRTSNSASSRNLRKKLMLQGNTSADLGDAGYLGVSHGKGIGLSHDTKKMSEKLMSRSLQSTTSPRINGQKWLVRNGLISPSNIARATHTVQSHDANSMDGNKGNAGELMFECEIPLSQAHIVGPKSEGNDPNMIDRAKGKGVMDELNLAEYEMEPNIIHRIKGKGVMTAFTSTKEHGIEPDTIDRKKDKGALEGFSSAKEYEIGPNIIDRTKGKGFMEEVVPAEDNETKTIQLSSRSSLNPTEEANGIRDAFNHLKEVGVWRSAHNRSKKMSSALSDEVEYLPRGKNSVDHLLNRNRVESEDNMKEVNFGSESDNHEGRDPFSYPIQASSSSRPFLDQRNRREVGRMKLTKRQRKRPSTHPNYGECSSSAFDNSDVTYLRSSRGSSDVRSSRSRNTRNHGISNTVIDIDEFSPEALVRSPNTSQTLNDESDDQARQVEADEILARELQEQFYNELEGISRGEIDANIAWTLQQEENAQRASFRRRPRVDTRDASMSHLYRQYPSQYFRSSLVRSANRARGHSSTRMAQLRNSFLSQSPALSSSEGIQFPPNMDIEMRMHILEALEAAVSNNDGMTMTSNIFQVQRDFNENDYEMLLALDEFNHQSGASLDQINGLPQSTVQTDNFEEACAICLETPTIGDAIRHLPCLHKFHKDCIDPWLRRKTSCPVCKSCIT